jgi:aspartyl-tRNA(Asn)/glutamyl-tRNA(Gln) amidotransferase subunit A
MFNAIQENKSALASGVPLVNILEHYLRQIEEHKHLNAYLEVFEASAREAVEKIQAKLNNGTAGRLAGTFVGFSVFKNIGWIRILIHSNRCTAINK